MKKWLVLIFLPLILLVSCATTPTTSSTDVYEYMKTVPIIDNKGMSRWEISNHTDEFNQPTNEKYIQCKDIIKGTFSNSATAHSDLSVGFIANKNDFAFCLLEYNYFPVTGGTDNFPDHVSIKVKYGDNVYVLSQIDFTGKIIYIYKKRDVLALAKIFVENPLVTFLVKIDKGFGGIQDTYLFDVCTLGFEEMYSKAFIES